MSLRIEKKFVVAAPADAVWAFLTDPRKVASCLPGASITGEIDEKTYAGAMNVKVGPVNAQYRGKLRFERLDAEAREAEIAATGQETRGKGGADMRMTSRVVALGPDETEVHVTSDVQVAGVLAQLGGRMIQDVSDQMFEKFTGAMRRQLEPGVVGAAAGAARAGAGDAAVSVPPRAASEPAPAASTSAGHSGTGRAGEAPPKAGDEPAAAPAQPEAIPSPKASAVTVPLSLAEPHGAEPATAPTKPERSESAAQATAEAAAAAAPSVAAGGPRPILAPAAAASAAASSVDQTASDPERPPALPREVAPSDAREPVAADRSRRASATTEDPAREGVLDLGALGASAARSAAGRTLRSPMFWIVVAAVAILLWLLLT